MPPVDPETAIAKFVFFVTVVVMLCMMHCQIVGHGFLDLPLSLVADAKAWTFSSH
jgi:hypothetical protein